MYVYRTNAKPPDPPPPSWWEQNKYLLWDNTKIVMAVIVILGLWVGYISALAWAAQKSVEALLGKEIPFTACFIMMIFFSPKVSYKKRD